MEDVFKFKKIKWEDLPEIGLYSDQVISYMEESLSALFLEGEKIITPSMINNYVKLGLIPKPIKKKYYRDHLAYLIVITLFKSILPIGDIKEGIDLQFKIMDIEKSFNEFMYILVNTIEEISSSFNIEDTSFKYKGFKAGIENLSVTFAINSFCFQLITKKILKIRGIYSGGIDEKNWNNNRFGK